jgi:hypothetical protein
MANTSISDAELRTALLSASARRSRLASVAPDVVRYLFDEGLIEVRLTEAGRWKLKELTDRDALAAEFRRKHQMAPGSIVRPVDDESATAQGAALLDGRIIGYPVRTREWL